MDDENVSNEDHPNVPDTATAVVASPPECIDRRIQRILEYLEDALSRADAFHAALGAANSDYLLLAYRLNQAIEKELEPGPVALAEFEDMMPAIEMSVKITKQVERVSKLEIKLAELNRGRSPDIALPSPTESR